MNELSLEKRLEAVEAKIVVIATGLSAILTELSGIEDGVKAEAQKPWDPSQIAWTEAEGNKGPYERSEDVNSHDFKCMVKDLADHKGKLTRGDFFYWLFQSGSVVGRKVRKK